MTLQWYPSIDNQSTRQCACNQGAYLTHPQYTELYTEEERTILSVRPGITDLATLWIQDKGNLVLGSDDPEKIYLEKIRPEKLFTFTLI